jgi:hypothetical protein
MATLKGNRVVIAGQEHNWEIHAIVAGEIVKTAWGYNKGDAYRKARTLADYYTDENGQSLNVDMPEGFINV